MLYRVIKKKVSVHLMSTVQLSGAQRLFDHSVYIVCLLHVHVSATHL